MPFPFMPVGAFVAALFLGSVFALFIAVMHVIDRTVTDVGGTVVGRLVAGFDDWSHDRGDPRASRHDGGADGGDGEPAVVDRFEPASPVPVEPARAIRR